MKGGTLFSGIGAPEFAAPEIDWRWCAEIDPFASAVHRKRFPNIPNLGDVEKINGSVEPVDVIVFGSPCQSFSIAGRRAGLDDPRGNLALIGLALVARLRPRWFVFENVPGLLSSDGGRDFGILLRAVEQCGYGWAYRTLDAQYFGLAQRRNRVFLVGYLGDWRRAGAVLFEPESLRGNPPPRRDAGQGTAAKSLCSTDGGIDREDRHTLIAPPLTAGPKRGGIGRGTDHDLDGGLVAYGGNNTAGALEVATAVRAKGGTGHGDFDSETFVAYRLYGGNDDVVEGAKAVDAIGAISSNNNRVGNSGSHVVFKESHFTRGKDGAPNCVTPPLSADADKGDQDLLVVADPISAHEADTYTHEGRGNFRLHNCVEQRSGVRRLMPVEAERLQGFPDHYTAIRYRSAPAADGPRYRSLGNSMAAPVIRWVLQRIMKGDMDG